uniref:Reverse transcriptase domain-containing protein n=1 Tax=Prevotella sp. GTC17253 TaxID=3236793 RepID=A0AB33IS03_9BACT
MQTILDLSHIKARRYFLESENYCNMQLPVYINFKPVLDYVQTVVDTKELKDILKDSKSPPSSFENVNHKILIKKDAPYSYRPIQLINPYLYYLLIKAMTNKGSWKEIKERFTTLKVTNIEVASIPKIKGKTGKSHLSASVSSWWDNIEQRSLELALSYRYMFVTDITNCYGAIYTHTIAWAMMGKEEAKQERYKHGLLGNLIDDYMRYMQYGQTNGIPQGSVLSDFIAEVVLAYADKQLGDRLDAEGINNYRILRYRDDYRIFCNSKEEIERIAFCLQEVLTELNFQLNAKKTYLTEEVITESIKPDKVAYISGIPMYRKTQKRIYSTMSNLQQEALYIHLFSKKYPNSGTLTKLLTTFAYRLANKVADSTNTHVLISIFTDIALFSPKVYKIALAIVSTLIEKIQTPSEREKIINDIYMKFQRFPNIGEIQIWMQRISFDLPHPIAYTEDICKIVNNEVGVELWNNDWVDDAYKNDFPQYEICIKKIRDSITPIIKIDEVSLFDIY